MKSKEKNKSVKVIGNNCKHNFNEWDHDWYEGTSHSRKSHICRITLNRCGLNHTCNCFDDQGKLYFERKE